MNPENQPQHKTLISTLGTVPMTVIDKSIQSLENTLKRMKSKLVIRVLVIAAISTLFIDFRIGIFIIAIYIAFYLLVKRTLRVKKFLQNYAFTRQLNLGAELDTSTFTGRLLRRTDSPKIGPYIFSTYGGFLTKMFYFSYSEWIGNRKNTYYFTVTEITVDQAEFPYLLLQRKNLKRHQDIDYFGEDKDVEVGLNAYNDIYTLHTTNQYEIEALQICTPEFIKLIQSSYMPLSVEFAGNHVYIYAQTQIEKESELDELYRVTKATIDTFGNFLLRIRDDYSVLHEAYKKERS